MPRVRRLRTGSGTMAAVEPPTPFLVAGAPKVSLTLAPTASPNEELKKALRDHVGNEIGAIAKPDMIRFTDLLPKTRSGKIMRRLLRDIAAGAESTGDVTTLEDFSVLAKLRDDEE